MTKPTEAYLRPAPPTGPARVMPPYERPPDGRLDTVRTLNDPYHPWQPPRDLARYNAWFERLRTQMKVSLGLWPMPMRTPLRPVIHGTIDKGDYTIDKVFFQSMPGHYVTGNLYRPKGPVTRRPAILSPHGHWRNGRFYDAGEAEAEKQVAAGAERYRANARFPLQARMATLARMGCVVFHYDMVGNADSDAIAHAAGFTNAEALLRLQSAMGLQTWNSIRALDFLLSLPDVDPQRVGVTGASGGGTQTFILCALDDRPAVAFPAVMVSTAMQGGCICENAPLLRVGSGNIAFAALFAPRPLGMSGADDWTRDIETRGLPELRRFYSLFRLEGNVMAKTHREFGHNYNQVSREIMYRWMNRHLALGRETLDERPIDPVPPEKLSVFNELFPKPKDARSAAELRQEMTKASNAALARLWPTDRASFQRYRRIVGAALRAMIVDEAPTAREIQVRHRSSRRLAGVTVDHVLLGRRQPELLFPKEAVPAAILLPEKGNGNAVVWIDPRGHHALFDSKSGAPLETAQALLKQGTAIIAPDVFLTGEYLKPGAEIDYPKVDERYAGYTFCYNRTVMANRVHDIITTVGCASAYLRAKSIDLVGLAEAGPWVILAKGVLGNRVRRTAADLQEFSFEAIKSAEDPRLLPGGLKYGDLPGLVALAAPDELLLGVGPRWQAAVVRWRGVYSAAGNPSGMVVPRGVGALSEAEVVHWLTR